MGLTALFGTIHGLHCTISVNFFFFFEKQPLRGNDFINASLKDQVDKHQEYLEEQNPSRQEKDF